MIHIYIRIIFATIIAIGTITTSGAVAQDSKQQKLEKLFKQLKKQKNNNAAQQISKQIWQEWQTSDNPTVNMLAEWARQAAQKQKYNVAMDILDQITSMKPEFAEGWNQRATIHFIKEEYGKSIADIEKTLAIEPRHFGALAGLGAIQQILGHKKKALETWYKTLELYPAMQTAQDAVVTLEEEIQEEKQKL